MKDAPLADLKTAANSFVDYLNIEDECAIIDFESEIHQTVDFTYDKDLLHNAINNLSAGGNTALWDAIKLGVDKTASSSNQRKAVIAMTDGLINAGDIREVSSLLDGIQTQNVPVYTISLGSNINAADLQTVAANTGGEYFNAPTSPELETIYNKMTIRTQQQYQLSFTVPNATGNTYSLQINIDISGIQGTGSGTIYH